MKPRKLVLPVCVLAGALGGADGGQAQEAGQPSTNGWRFSLAPYLWATSLDGDVTVKGRMGEVDLDFEDILQDLNFAGMLLLDAGNGRFGLAGNAFVARTEDEAGRIDVTNDTVFLAAAAYYRVLEGGSVGVPERARSRWAIEPLAGIRYNYVRAELDGEIRLLGGRIRREVDVDASEQWVDPVVGLRGFVWLTDRLGLAGEADIGGFDVGSELAWNAQAYLSYRVSVFGVPTDLAVGYRHYSVDYEDGEFEYDVDTYGPILGAAFHF